MHKAMWVILLAVLLAGCTARRPESPVAPVSVPQAAPVPAQPQPTPRPADLSAVLDAAWSPDSGRLAMLRKSGLQILDINSQQVTAWPQPYTSHMKLVGWKQDGSGVYLQTGDQSLLLIDPSGGHEAAFGRDSIAGNPPYPIWQPQGDRVLARAVGGWEVRSLRGESVLQLPGATNADWSADGSRIVYQDRAGLWTIDADGKNKQPLLTKPIEGLQSMVWLVQDEIVFCSIGKAGGGGITFAMGLITGGEVQSLETGTRSTLLASPDRRRVAYFVGPPTDEIPASLAFYPALK